METNKLDTLSSNVINVRLCACLHRIRDLGLEGMMLLVSGGITKVAASLGVCQRYYATERAGGGATIITADTK